MVLLDALTPLARGCGNAVSAVHVDHGISPHADRWARFCAEQCEARGVALLAHRLVLGPGRSANLEAIARNVAYNRIRSQRTAKRGAETVDINDRNAASEPVAPTEPDYAQREEAALRSRLLHDAIAELPQGSRECIQLWLNDFKYDEIARFLGITLDAVKSRLRDAKKILRARLGDSNALPEDEE